MWFKPDNWWKFIALAALLQSAFTIPWWIAFALFLPLGFVNYIVQWYIGEMKDRKDLIALEQEWNNRRNKFMRELRETIGIPNGQREEI